MNSGSIYLIVRNFEKSIDFYKNLLGIPVRDQNMNRFAIFNFNGFCINIMNGFFDSQNRDKVIRKGKYCSDYDDFDKIAMADNPGKCVINLSTEDLRIEYERIQSLETANWLTPIRYINARNPYYYFSLKDPDGNIIEVTGKYEPEKDEFNE